jgi:NhaP-type Na+/H+ and K+/H+ antiporter
LVFNGDVTLGTLAELYGLPVLADEMDETLAHYFVRHLNAHPVIGDRLDFGGLRLVVREVDGDRIARVGLEITPERRRAPRLPLFQGAGEMVAGGLRLARRVRAKLRRWVARRRERRQAVRPPK